MSSGLSIFGYRVQSLPRAGEKTLYPLPDKKLSALSKFKVFEDDSFIVAQTVQFFFFFLKAQKTLWEMEKMLVTSIFFFFFFFFHFLAMFSKAFSSRVIEN